MRARSINLVVVALFGVAQPSALASLDDHLYTFELKAEPLPAALSRFTEVTGVELVAASAQVQFKYSSPVIGSMTLVSAIKALLSATNLKALRMDNGSFVIYDMKPDHADAIGQAQAGTFNDSQPGKTAKPYYGAVQRGVTDALCGLPPAELLGDLVTIRLTIDPVGVVTSATASDRAGVLPANSGIASAINHLQLPERPPPDLGQPVTLMVDMRAFAHWTGCLPIRQLHPTRRLLD